VVATEVASLNLHAARLMTLALCNCVRTSCKIAYFALSKDKTLFSGGHVPNGNKERRNDNPAGGTHGIHQGDTNVPHLVERSA
jgi:hypothetical protein